VNDYDTASIERENVPLKETIALTQKADVVVTSTLRRVVDSAKVLV
jgi:hypothetical protein